MSNAFSRLLSRRGFLFMGTLAVAGSIVGCSDSAPTKLEEPTLQKGNRKRLDSLIKEKADKAAEKKR